MKKAYQTNFVVAHITLYGDIKRKHIISTLGCAPISASVLLKKVEAMYPDLMTYDIQRRCRVLNKSPISADKARTFLSHIYSVMTQDEF